MSGQAGSSRWWFLHVLFFCLECQGSITGIQKNLVTFWLHVPAPNAKAPVDTGVFYCSTDLTLRINDSYHSMHQEIFKTLRLWLTLSENQFRTFRNALSSSQDVHTFAWLERWYVQHTNAFRKPIYFSSLFFLYSEKAEWRRRCCETPAKRKHFESTRTLRRANRSIRRLSLAAPQFAP